MSPHNIFLIPQLLYDNFVLRPTVYEYHTLANGLKIILSRTPSRVTYSGVYINVGSRDEAGADEGMRSSRAPSTAAPTTY